MQTVRVRLFFVFKNIVQIKALSVMRINFFEKNYLKKKYYLYYRKIGSTMTYLNALVAAHLCYSLFVTLLFTWSRAHALTCVRILRAHPILCVCWSQRELRGRVW